jgi:predicted  nucleic acid-binding Zn-ribbon protein
MSDEQKNQQDVSPTVSMFQKAHAALVTLQRIDEQIAQLADRRRKVQGELREAQSQLNEEIDRAAAMPEEASMKIASSRRAPIAEAA